MQNRLLPFANFAIAAMLLQEIRVFAIHIPNLVRRIQTRLPNPMAIHLVHARGATCDLQQLFIHNAIQT